MQYFVPGRRAARAPTGIVMARPHSRSHSAQNKMDTQRLLEYTAWTRRRKRNDDESTERIQQQALLMKMRAQLPTGMAKTDLVLSVPMIKGLVWISHFSSARRAVRNTMQKSFPNF